MFKFNLSLLLLSRSHHHVNHISSRLTSVVNHQTLRSASTTCEHSINSSLKIPFLTRSCVKIDARPCLNQKNSIIIDKPTSRYIDLPSQVNITSLIVPNVNQLIVWNMNMNMPSRDMMIGVKLPDFKKHNGMNNEMECIKKKKIDPRAYSHLIIIRRRKMKKHKLRKFRKKYKTLISRIKLRREIKKEKLFRAELLAQIKEAEDFNPEVYVKNILDTIDNMPMPETPKEKVERVRELIRKNKSDTHLIAPKFED